MIPYILLFFIAIIINIDCVKHPEIVRIEIVRLFYQKFAYYKWIIKIDILFCIMHKKLLTLLALALTASVFLYSNTRLSVS